ncbi:MAG: hypothetical protein U0670_22055 [Anaerolineae bacterium]
MFFKAKALWNFFIAACALLLLIVKWDELGRITYTNAVPWLTMQVIIGFAILLFLARGVWFLRRGQPSAALPPVAQSPGQSPSDSYRF